MRTKDEENEQRQRQQILNVAWKLFHEKGYQDTTMAVSYTHLDVYKRQMWSCRYSMRALARRSGASGPWPP